MRFLRTTIFIILLLNLFGCNECTYDKSSNIIPECYLRAILENKEKIYLKDLFTSETKGVCYASRYFDKISSEEYPEFASHINKYLLNNKFIGDEGNLYFFTTDLKKISVSKFNIGNYQQYYTGITPQSTETNNLSDDQCVSYTKGYIKKIISNNEKYILALGEKNESL